MASYAAVTTTDALESYEARNTIIIHTGTNNINPEQFINDMSSQGLWKDIKGMQISKENIEIVCIDEDVRNNILTNGINTHGQLLLARSEMPTFTNVSLMGVPLEMPPQIAQKALSRYGSIKGHFMVKKKFGGLVIFNGVRVYQFRAITKHIPRFLTILNRRVKVIYTGQPAPPPRVDVQKNKELINAGSILPDVNVTQVIQNENDVNVDINVETQKGNESNETEKEINKITETLSDVENVQEIEMSPPVTNPRKIACQNSKPPSDDDDETIENRVDKKRSIGQTQLRAYIIRRKYNPKKVTLFKSVSVDIINQVCASVLISDVGVFNRDFNGGELTEGVRMYWKMFSKNTLERNNVIQLNLLTEINKKLQQKKMKV